MVRGLVGGASAAQWSPDGWQIAYLREGGPCVSLTGKDEDFSCEAELVIVNLFSGEQRIIEGIRTPEIGRARIAWNPRV